MEQTVNLTMIPCYWNINYCPDILIEWSNIFASIPDHIDWKANYEWGAELNFEIVIILLLIIFFLSFATFFSFFTVTYPWLDIFINIAKQLLIKKQFTLLIYCDLIFSILYYFSMFYKAGHDPLYWFCGPLTT